MQEDEQAAQQDMQSQAMQLEYALGAYQERLGTIEAQINRIMLLLDNLNKEKEILDQKNNTQGKHALIPIGGSLLIGVNTNSMDHVYVNVGGGFVVESNAVDALNIIKKRIDKTTANLNILIGEKRKLQDIIYETSYRLEQLVG